MMQAKTAVVAIALCVALQIATTQGKVTTVAQKSKFFGSNRLIFDKHSFENTTFVYASCTPVEGKTNKSCKVYLAINDLEPIKECSLNLSLRNDNREISPYMRTFLMGKNMAIIAYTIVDKNQDKSEENKKQIRPTSIRFAIVDMSNCDVRDVATIDIHKKVREIDAFSVDVVPYDNTFDVIFESRTGCEDKYCRVTIDDKGIKLTENIPWIKSLEGFLFLEPLESRSPKMGHLVLNFGPLGWTSQTALVKDNQIKDLQIPAAGAYPSLLSTSHGAATVCYNHFSKPDTYMICVQYDLVTGQTKFQASIKIRCAYSDYGAVYNLPEGKGFLLMTPECDDIRSLVTIRRYHVHKLDASGQTTGHRLLDGPECPIEHSSIVSQFYTNEANQHCLTIVCFATNNSKETTDGDEWLKFTTKCFDDKDLSQ